MNFVSFRTLKDFSSTRRFIPENLDWFISTNAGHPLPLYIHGNMYTPIPPVSRVRKTIYQLFNRLIPQEAHMCLSMVRYRLRFYHIAELSLPNSDYRYPNNPNKVKVTHLHTTRFWSPPIHPEECSTPL